MGANMIDIEAYEENLKHVVDAIDAYGNGLSCPDSFKCYSGCPMALLTPVTIGNKPERTCEFWHIRDRLYALRYTLKDAILAEKKKDIKPLIVEGQMRPKDSKIYDVYGSVFDTGPGRLQRELVKYTGKRVKITIEEVT